MDDLSLDFENDNAKLHMQLDGHCHEVVDESDMVNNDCDFENNVLNYEESDDDMAVPSSTLLSGTRSSWEIQNEMTAITSSDTESLVSENDADFCANMKDELGPSCISLDCDIYNKQKEPAFEDRDKRDDEDLEEGEIRSDSEDDDDIPIIKEGIFPRELQKTHIHLPFNNQVAPKPPKFTRIDATCKFFLRGSCNWGDSCKFYHPKNILSQNNFSPLVNIPVISNSLHFQMNSASASNHPQILPPILGPTLPVPLLSVITQPPPLPPLLLRTKNPDEITNAWERGLRQAREMRKKNDQKQSASSNSQEILGISELIPIDSSEEAEELSILSADKWICNPSSVRSAEGSSNCQSPELITLMPDEPKSTNFKINSSNKEASQNDRKSLGSDLFSDPWARKRRKSNEEMRNYSRLTSASRSFGQKGEKNCSRSSDSSSTSSRPTIPDDDLERSTKRPDRKSQTSKTYRPRHRNRRSSSSSNRSRKTLSPDLSSSKRNKRRYASTTLRTLLNTSDHSVSSKNDQHQNRRQSYQNSVRKRENFRSRSSSRSQKHRNSRRYKRLWGETRSTNSDLNTQNFFQRNEDDVPAVYRLDRSEIFSTRSKNSSSSSSSSSSNSSKSTFSEVDSDSHLNHKKKNISETKANAIHENNISSDSGPEKPYNSLKEDALTETKLDNFDTKSKSTLFVEHNGAEIASSTSEDYNDNARKKEEILRQLKSVEEAIARATNSKKLKSSD